MSLDLKLNPLHDLSIEDRNLVIVDGAAQVRQQIKISLMTWLGEYFLDDTFGVPYLESILVKSPSRNEIESVLRARINDVPGVDRVIGMTLDIDRQRRTLAVSFTASTPEGLVRDVVTITE